jgi:hypothetical protein
VTDVVGSTTWFYDYQENCPSGFAPYIPDKRTPKVSLGY